MQLNRDTIQQFESLLKNYGEKIHESERLLINFEREKLSTTELIRQMEATEKELRMLTKYFLMFESEKLIRQMKVQKSLLTKENYLQFVQELRASENTTSEIISKAKKPKNAAKQIIEAAKEFNAINNRWYELFNHISVNIIKTETEFGNLRCFDDRVYPTKIRYFCSNSPAAMAKAAACIPYVASAYHLLASMFGKEPQVYVFVLGAHDWAKVVDRHYKTGRPYGATPISFMGGADPGIWKIAIPEKINEPTLSAQLEAILPILSSHELTHIFFNVCQPFELITTGGRLHDEILADMIAFLLARNRTNQLRSLVNNSLQIAVKRCRGWTIKNFLNIINGRTKGNQSSPLYSFAQVMIFQAILDYYSTHAFSGLKHDSAEIYRNILKVKW